MTRRSIRINAAVVLGAFALLAASSSRPYHVRITASNGGTDPLVVAFTASGAHLVSPGVPRLKLDIDPAPVAMPDIKWTSSDPQRVQVMQGVPWERVMTLPGDSSSTPAPPADQVNAVPGKESGFAWISATVGAPVNVRVSIPAYKYATLAIGCMSWGFSPASAFNGHAATSIADSDIYATGPPGTYHQPTLSPVGCPPAFATNETHFVLHVPFGGTTFASADFTRISTRDWRNSFTQVPGNAVGGLLFKTHDRRFVKVQYVNYQREGTTNGSYALAPANGEFPDVLALKNVHPRIESLKATAAPHGFSVRIGYSDPLTTTTGSATALFTEMPLEVHTPFYQMQAEARVFVSPQPYVPPQVTWSLDGAVIAQQPLSGWVRLEARRPGHATLSAQIGAPVSKTVSIPVITYHSLAVGCGVGVQGVRFVHGLAAPADNAASSDLFVSSDPEHFACARDTVLYFPGGGVLLTNGHERARSIPKEAVAGPQFPELTKRYWQNRYVKLTGDMWDAFAEPCTVPESPGIERIDWNCKTIPAKTLLFRTRSGAYVKLLLVHANGTSIMGGPYEVLSE